MTKCIEVNRNEAEHIRRELISLNLLDNNYAPKAEDDGIYFPVKGQFRNFKLVEKKLKERAPGVFSLEDSLRSKLTPEEFGLIVKSFDVIGDIAIVEIPKKLEKKEKLIAASLLSVHRNVKSVFKKLGPMEGVYRTRKLKFLAGERKTVTEYKENNCRFRLDVTKVYFTPRLSFERKRIAEQVKPGERILALFAGVGPFPIVIVKMQPQVKIHAVELNPDAFKYMEENIRLNRMQEAIIPILGDVKDIIPKRFVNSADRILMPLPKGAEKFLGEAFLAARKNCIIHFYQFASEQNPFEDTERFITKEAMISGRKAEVIAKRVVRPFAPGVVQVVLDFRVK
ncbi:MAG: class I SAM-dependent methyltransferase family protein [Candidatus Micrarchaeota archaeon]|nr:class I SAM-dependent methyltransferase family protein [Candidatus Micrarchaeota archaeon]